MRKKSKRRLKNKLRARVRAGGEQRGAPPKLTENEVLAWADAFHVRTGRWPTARSGPVAQVPGENWNAVSDALRSGFRGLPGGSSLARLLAQERGVRNRQGLPSLTCSEIIRWADLYHDRRGSWPNLNSGPIPEVAGETWKGVNVALMHGRRGLPGGTTLKRLLWEYRGVNYGRTRGPFTVEGILAWADAHHARTGNWPDAESGRIPECPGGVWQVVDVALARGTHGLPGGSSLSRLLAERRAVRNRYYAPDLTISQIRDWVEAFVARTGRSPAHRSGAILEAPGETWYGIKSALREGKRGLPRGLTLRALRENAKRDKSAEASGRHLIGETRCPDDPVPSEATIPEAATARRIASRKAVAQPYVSLAGDRRVGGPT